MRLLVAVTVVALALSIPAYAQRTGDGQSHVYFWEDAYGYGWSDVIDPRHLNDPPKIIKKRRISVDELCARLVGRQMRVDQSSRVRSIQLEDSCVRNGGRI